MSFSLYQLLVDHREGLVAQLSKALGKSSPAYGAMPKSRVKEEVGHLFDGVVDQIAAGDSGKMEAYFLYLVRRTSQNMELADVVTGLLTVPVVLRQFLQAAYREQVVGGGRAAFEQTMTEVEEGCHQAVRRFCELYQEHVKEQVRAHNEEGGEKLGEQFNRLILFKG